MTEQELMYASDEDIAFFHKCTAGLPGVEGFSGTGFDAKGERIPYGVGPHSVRCFREIVSIVKPKSILEIGFNLGYSASLWLNLAEARLVSVDISDKEETLYASKNITKKFNNRFNFICSDSADIELASTFKLIHYFGGVPFDLIFIDGGHLEHHVMADIKLALDLGIKWLAFDDVLPQFGPGVLPAIAKHPQLEEVKTMGNIALYKNTSV